MRSSSLQLKDLSEWEKKMQKEQYKKEFRRIHTDIYIFNFAQCWLSTDGWILPYQMQPVGFFQDRGTGVNRSDRHQSLATSLILNESFFRLKHSTDYLRVVSLSTSISKTCKAALEPSFWVTTEIRENL